VESWQRFPTACPSSSFDQAWRLKTAATPRPLAGSKGSMEVTRRKMDEDRVMTDDRYKGLCATQTYENQHAISKFEECCLENRRSKR